jgi:hypothetical protein
MSVTEFECPVLNYHKGKEMKFPLKVLVVYGKDGVSKIGCPYIFSGGNDNGKDDNLCDASGKEFKKDEDYGYRKGPRCIILEKFLSYRKISRNKLE